MANSIEELFAQNIVKKQETSDKDKEFDAIWGIGTKEEPTDDKKSMFSLSRPSREQIQTTFAQARTPEARSARQERRQETIEDIRGIGQDAKTAFQEGREMTNEAIAAREAGTQGRLQTGFQRTGAAAGVVADTIGAAIEGVVKGLLPQEQENQLKETIANVVTKIPFAEDAIAGLERLRETRPELARDIDSALNLVNLGLEATGVGATPALGSATGRVAVRGADIATDAARTAGSVVEGGLEAAGRGVASATAPVAGVAEATGATISSALQRGGSAVSESINEAQRIAKLPPVEKALVRSGLDESVIEFIKTSTPKNISKYGEIIKRAKTSSGDLRDGTAAKKVVGETIIQDIVKPVVNQRNKVGARIGRIVEELPRTRVAIDDIVSDFEKTLNSVGVTVNDKGKLVAGRGAVQGDLKAYQNMYNRITGGDVTYRDLHDIRGGIFKEFDLAKGRQQAFSDQADQIAERLRSRLAEPIAEVSEQYLTESARYADIMQRLKEFVKYTGYKGDLEKFDSQSLRVAEIAQRVLGNASARPQQVIDDIAALADTAGGTLSQDITDLIRFSDLIEDFYGIQQTRSLAGQVARGTSASVDDAVGSLAESAAQGGITGLVGRTVKGIFGKTKAEQQRALEMFIDSLNK